MRPDSDNYRQIFLSGFPLMDTRAPVEFTRGSFPGAVNLPLMTDEERAEVGTRYRKEGQQAAIALGHDLVNSEIKDKRVNNWLAFARQNPDGYLFCFRGGLRSQIVQQWMAEAGIEYPRVIGGYKAMRHFLLLTMDQVAIQQPILVLGGQTGCAKTDLLQELPCHLDLEGFANHRGSAFGRRVGGQPSQIDFENALAVQMLRQTHDENERALVLEDESKLIGRMFVPHCLQARMQEAPLVLLEASLETRIEHTFRNYILHNLLDWQKVAGEEAGFKAFADELRQSLHRIHRRLGGERFRKIGLLLESAITAHLNGDETRHCLWISELLTGYYDPMYDYHLKNKAPRIIFRGDARAVTRFILEWRP